MEDKDSYGRYLITRPCDSGSSTNIPPFPSWRASCLHLVFLFLFVLLIAGRQQGEDEREGTKQDDAPGLYIGHRAAVTASWSLAPLLSMSNTVQQLRTHLLRDIIVLCHVFYFSVLCSRMSCFSTIWCRISCCRCHMLLCCLFNCL